MDKIGFWSTKDEYGVFSNWYRCKFVYKGIMFNSSEQALMYEKAIVFDNIDIANQILNTTSQRDIKSLGRKVKNYDNRIWSRIRYDLMVDILKCKFEQNNKLKEILKSTGNSIIYEASPTDNIWGIGTTDIDNPNGLNLLGKALMEVRDII